MACLPFLVLLACVKDRLRSQRTPSSSAVYTTDRAAQGLAAATTSARRKPFESLFPEGLSLLECHGHSQDDGHDHVQCCEQGEQHQGRPMR